MSRILSRKLALEVARANNLKIVKGSRHVLLLDLDEPEDVDHFDRMLPIVQTHLEIKEVARWQSSGGGTHVKLKARLGLSIRTRLLLQACLGSDRVKEFLSYMRVRKGQKYPVMLFKPNWAAKRLPPSSRVSDETYGFGGPGTEHDYGHHYFDDDVPF